MTFFDAKDIAMIEHELLSENDILDAPTETMMFYLAGVHDLADKIIKIIKEKEGDV